jgi:hypothetical protein
MWINLAEAQGSKFASEAAQELRKMLGASQIAKAHKLAVNCKARNYKGC